VTIFERRQRLLDILRKEPGLRVPEMADALEVSEGTIRNDLNALEADGLLERVRGGAILTGDVPVRSLSFLSRLKKNAGAKLAIARQAAELVEDGDSILLDASTTVYFIARFLQNRRKLRVITNGIEIARLLAQNPTNTVILLGGVLNTESTSITGLISERIVQDLHVKTAFVSCSGITPESGLTEVHK
jgi:DeoR/GlpR family transcriptional regulator of sugar metabolism